MLDIALILGSLILAALRFSGVTHEAFQALAHAWVGGLCGAAMVSRTWERWTRAEPALLGARWRLYLTLALILTFVVKVPCAVLGVGR